MSFFKKLTDEFKELKANFEDKPKKEEKKEDKPEKPLESSHADTREGDHGGQPPYGAQHAPYDQHAQAPYGQQPQYGDHSQSQQQYGAPPPSHANPPAQPPLPPGWITQFDQNSQRWYFVEQATGRTQWDPPAFSHGGYAPPPTGPSDAYTSDRGHGGAPGAAGGFYNPQAGYGTSSHDQNAQQYYGDMKKTEEKSEKKAGEKKDEKNNNARNMMLAGAGGLAVGGVAGAMLAHDSDDENSHAAPAAYGGGGYGGGAYNAPPPGPPANDSDAESLHEAQQNYNDAVEAAADSDASSSELEELQEAREELEEEQEDYED
ncbi:uncharacterized protein RCC_02166 [Ramularia collo-cygni]|uniref:WW domain-containing protein n=1 Tax=Ramularia collo-cygni TaxID=112498 RepID=A0A2D3V1I3_9PEZI|nr:uncharacterized protein RCC_02166 [Ramularia collo-cygni]CZT16324.1 uncharacterized protein RCC_02166 [Ramularia collo-cygni]